MSNDYIAPILAKLTSNGAISLWSAIEHPRTDDQCGQLFTGGGKYTVLAERGVESHLRKHGLIVDREETDGWQTRVYRVWSPLGLEVAAYVHKHWEDLLGTFQEGSRR